MDKEKVKEAFSIFISSIVVFFVFLPIINWVLNLLNIKPPDEFIKLFQALLIALFNQCRNASVTRESKVADAIKFNTVNVTNMTGMFQV